MRLADVRVQESSRLECAHPAFIRYYALVGMARLHAMNLRSWRHDERARHAFDPMQLDQLEQELDLIASGRAACPPVLLELTELAARPS